MIPRFLRIFVVVLWTLTQQVRRAQPGPPCPECGPPVSPVLGFSVCSMWQEAEAQLFPHAFSTVLFLFFKPAIQIKAVLFASYCSLCVFRIYNLAKQIGARRNWVDEDAWRALEDLKSRWSSRFSIILCCLSHIQNIPFEMWLCFSCAIKDAVEFASTSRECRICWSLVSIPSTKPLWLFQDGHLVSLIAWCIMMHYKLSYISYICSPFFNQCQCQQKRLCPDIETCRPAVAKESARVLSRRVWLSCHKSFSLHRTSDVKLKHIMHIEADDFFDFLLWVKPGRLAWDLLGLLLILCRT